LGFLIDFEQRLESEWYSETGDFTVDDVKVQVDGRVLILTISRPEKKNALTGAMYGALADALESAGHERVNAVLIQSDGDTFSAGSDMSEFSAEAIRDGIGKSHGARFLRCLAAMEVPVVAAVQGKAIGVGATMLLHCDYVILANDAQLSAPFVDLALVPEAASGYLLPFQVGNIRAFEMIALGRSVDAQTAVEWGIANRSVPADQLRAEAKAIAEVIAAKAPGAIRATKRLMSERSRVIDQMNAEFDAIDKQLTGNECSEALAAFKEKRRPDFSKLQ
jgi:enoyl-CoA hydratase/carnithine racemase